MTRIRLILAAIATCAGAACDPTTAPRGEQVRYTLRALDGQPLPASLSSTAGGRVIEVTGGELTFQSLAARGAVSAVLSIRTTDPGAAPRTERLTSTGVSVRRGAALDVAFPSGGRMTFAVEAGGASLRTTAAAGGCPPTVSCLSVLHVYHYVRGTAPAEP